MVFQFVACLLLVHSLFIFKSGSGSISSSGQPSLRSILFKVVLIYRCSASSFSSSWAATASPTSPEPTTGNEHKSNGTSTSVDSRLSIRGINCDSCGGKILPIWNSRRWSWWSNWLYGCNRLNRFDRLYWYNWSRSWLHWLRFYWRRRRWRRRLVCQTILPVKHSFYTTRASGTIRSSARLASRCLGTQ